MKRLRSPAWRHGSTSSGCGRSRPKRPAGASSTRWSSGSGRRRRSRSAWTRSPRGRRWPARPCTWSSARGRACSTRWRPSCGPGRAWPTSPRRSPTPTPASTCAAGMRAGVADLRRAPRRRASPLFSMSALDPESVGRRDRPAGGTTVGRHAVPRPPAGRAGPAPRRRHRRGGRRRAVDARQLRQLRRALHRPRHDRPTRSRRILAATAERTLCRDVEPVTEA